MADLELNAGARQALDTGALLLDVRTQEEFASGHIPGSKNLPLQIIDRIVQKYPDKAAPIYVYCRSGVRSKQAKKRLLTLGYQNVYDLGGIQLYRGELEK